MKRVVWALALSACAQTPNALDLSAHKLPPARITTRSELVLRCEPVDAEVSLNGVPQGTCEDFSGEPKGLTMPKGPRVIRVKKNGYLPWESILDTDGTRVVINITLISTGGTP